MKDEIDLVERLVTRRYDIGLSDILPEYRWLIDGNASYSTAVGRATGPLLYNDVLNKLLTVDYVFAPVYRRINLDSFEASYGLTPEEYLRLFDESNRVVPMSMAPPWSLEKPRFFKNIIKKLYKKFGYYPPPAWVRITDYFARKLSLNEDLSMEELITYWRAKTKMILKMDPEGLARLSQRHKREYEELLDIISTKSAQLHLFGYKKILNIIFETLETIKNSELLYSLVTLYHKYLISGVLDYVGGVVIWLGDATPPEKLGIVPDYKILGPLLMRLRVTHKNLYDVDITWDKKLPLSLLKIVEKIRDSSIDYYNFISNINKIVKIDLNKFIEISQKLDDIVVNHINLKIQRLEGRIKLISKLVTTGLVILLGDLLGQYLSLNIKNSTYIGMLALAAREILANLGATLGTDYIENLVRRTIEESIKTKMLRDPLGALQGKGFFWVVWSARKTL